MYHVKIQNNLSRLFTSTELSPPTVRIFKPTSSDLSTSDVLTLLCLVSGFSPSHLMLHWEKNGHKLNPIYYTTSVPWKYEGSSTYSLSSRLSISKPEDRGSLYSCVVAHEFSEDPFKSSFKDIWGKHLILNHHYVFGTLLLCICGPTSYMRYMYRGTKLIDEGLGFDFFFRYVI